MDDESPVVVDTVAWTKPEPAAERERRAAASRRKRSRDSSTEQPTRESRPGQRPRAQRPTANHPPVPVLPRWAFPLVISMIGLLAYGVWMVWTA